MLEQNQNLETKNQYQLRQGNWSRFWLVFLQVASRILNFFNLVQTKQFWGIVYDSVSKQPLDPVIVKLLYTNGQEVQTCVTDLAGRYGFLARSGKFKIFARKTNFTFPSKFASGDSDGIYENLYHGEFFELQDGSDVIAPNIPMDPADFDWNQMAKLQLINRHPFTKLFFKRLVGIFFWFGFILCSVYVAHYFPKPPVYLDALAAFYLIILILAVTAPEPRLWGKLVFKDIREPFSNLSLELRNPKFPEIIMGRAQVYLDDKFLLRANKGNYTLMLITQNANKEKIILARAGVRVGRVGVLNSSLILK